MTGENLRSLREAKSWSQAHLAQAAGLNIRTVQRIEAGEACSFETMLSIAAALDVAVSELEPAMRKAVQAKPNLLILATSVVSLLPALLFLSVNLMRSAGLPAPYEWSALIGSQVMSFHTFNVVSPPVFVGGGVMAFILCLPYMVRLRGRIEHDVLTLTGIELRMQPFALAVALLGLGTAGALMLYAAMEQLRTVLG